MRVADPGSPGQKILKRLAWGACDVAEGARRWGSKSRRREGPEPGPARGGGGDDHSKEGDDGDDASSSFFFGASVAPGDVAWFKTAARLRVTLALTEGAESEEVEGRSTTTRASPSGPSGPSGARDSDSAADSASATAAVVASATAAVIACLDPTAAPYEARHAAMKALRDADASLVRSRLDVRALRRTLATRLLPRETGHGCARRALQLLAAWSPTESPSYVSDEDAESDLEVSSACWDAAAELAANRRRHVPPRPSSCSRSLSARSVPAQIRACSSCGGAPSMASIASTRTCTFGIVHFLCHVRHRRSSEWSSAPSRATCSRYRELACRLTLLPPGAVTTKLHGLKVQLAAGSLPDMAV